MFLELKSLKYTIRIINFLFPLIGECHLVTRGLESLLFPYIADNAAIFIIFLCLPKEKQCLPARAGRYKGEQLILPSRINSFTPISQGNCSSGRVREKMFLELKSLKYTIRIINFLFPLRGECHLVTRGLESLLFPYIADNAALIFILHFTSLKGAPVHSHRTSVFQHSDEPTVVGTIGSWKNSSLYFCADLWLSAFLVALSSHFIEEVLDSSFLS
jgi:hypothetical protein